LRLLLDTHALLWWLDGNSKLVPGAAAAISDPDNFVAVSSVSIWEVAIKVKIRRLAIPSNFDVRVTAGPLEPLPITHRHALAAGALPLHHDDPFDRMLVAQAQLEGLTLVTRDPRMRLYDVAVLPA
jgi:PIN domain nuclease of toxin-antitoxin system